ncbi:hypothetical protein KAFR_0D02260 [Kazachstania africana CBS 2517]|uniref:Pantoate--beta-alanine ligase n=1 Tax=Kazachstania africana (strain ATCC 22294 / BCRC 22015 / CBS 2517 / CECT 1963 / NBRC 1671 / NRRL Y-8276) TaxID=1071382 RepID=H2AU23_KAZAF|nr:hypothetical protein KAFR_0D02260 [Kazachstania africana CBS 2517]CCF57873.1 hypothetical protein KAFR_0D02260 [Kazachstania africana CBS 2517]
MKIFHSVGEVIEWRKCQVGDRRNISVGFVPTMGCLHNGHATLIKESTKDNDYTVVSIFVNPSQFAPTEDLDKYPRTLENDIKLLESLKVDVLFAPTAREMYPRGIPLNVEEQKGPFISVLGVSEMLEGKTRPNFFRGVATVVTKLFNIVMPDVAYFGQKDIQQFIVLNCMVNELFFNIKLKMIPIVRNEAGLALSSRNKYLCDESLVISSNLFKGLQTGSDLISVAKQNKTVLKRQNVIDAIKATWKRFLDSGDFRIDYVSIADWNTLNELQEIEPSDIKIVISCAVYVTDRLDKGTVVRLIDNIIV